MELLQSYIKPSNYIDGLVQDCGNSSALAIELPQSWAIILKFVDIFHWYVYKLQLDLHINSVQN